MLIINNLISRFFFFLSFVVIYIIWCNHHRFSPPSVLAKSRFANRKSYLVLGKWHLRQGAFQATK